MSLLSLAAAALAQDDAGCGVPFTEFDLRALVEQSDAAMLDDDALAHSRLFTEFVTRVPCLDAQVPKDALARLLLNEAIVRRIQGKPWMPVLDTALDIWSELPVPDYLRSQFSPLPPPAPAEVELPADVALFVDGVLLPAVPALAGEHVVQTWRDRRWRSVWVDDAPVPPAWIAARKEVVVDTGPARWKPASRGTFGGSIGPHVGRQFVSEPREYLGDQQQYALAVGIGTTGVVPVVDNVGVYWDATFATQVVAGRRTAKLDWTLDGPRVVPDAVLGPAVVLEDVAFGLGGGVVQALYYQGEDAFNRWLPQVDAMVVLRQDRTDFGARIGGWVNGMHGTLSVGSVSATDRPVTLRVGVDGDLVVALLTEAAPGTRSASALDLTTTFRVDAAWGRDR